MAKFKDERHWKVYKGVEKYINFGTMHLTFKELMMIIDPKKTALDMVMKWIEFYDLKVEARVDAFGRAKWINLDEFLAVNATTDPQTLEEAASLIPKWIECEEMALAKETIETAKS